MSPPPAVRQTASVSGSMAKRHMAVCCRLLRLEILIGKIGALLCSPDSNDQQRDAADDGQPPDKGRKRNGLFLINRGLERTEVDHIFSGRVADAFVGKCHDAEHDERDAEDCCCFHVHALSREAAQLYLARDAGPPLRETLTTVTTAQ